MGGLVGTGVVKFFVSAGLLHCPIDVNLHRAEAVLDPLLATSMISSGFARRLHLAPRGRVSVTAYGAPAELATTGPVSVAIHPATFHLARLAIEDDATAARAPAKADIILGADALASTLLRLDLRRHQLSSISASDSRGATRGLTPIAIHLDAVGHLLVSVRIGTAAPVDAIVDLGSDHAVTVNRTATTILAAVTPPSSPDANSPSDASGKVAVLVNDLSFGPRDVRVSDQSPDAVVIGAALFDQRIVILDIAHKTIWISK